MPLDSTRRFCRSCGDRKRLTWPKHSPRYCSMRCAAESFDSYSELSMDWDAAYCTNCGKIYDSHLFDDNSPCDHEIYEGEE